MLKRKTPLRTSSPMKASRKRKTQDKRWRSEPYLTWVRSLPCCNCQGIGGDPHHVIGLHWGLSGQGLTAPDSFAMPLCRLCHNEVHRSPELQREQPDWLRQTLRRGIAQFDGVTRDELTHALAFVEAKSE